MIALATVVYREVCVPRIERFPTVQFHHMQPQEVVAIMTDLPAAFFCRTGRICP